MRENTYIRFERTCKKIKGYIETRELLEEGFSTRQIATLEREEYLEKVCHGYYWIKGQDYEKPKDYKCIEICLSAPRAVICTKSALYYQNVLMTEPEYLSVATERTDRSSLHVAFPVKRHYFSKNIYGVGIEKRETEFGSYNIYDVERSICDVIRLNDEISLEIVCRLEEKRQNYDHLAKYAELLKIRNPLETVPEPK